MSPSLLTWGILGQFSPHMETHTEIIPPICATFPKHFHTWDLQGGRAIWLSHPRLIDGHNKYGSMGWSMAAPFPHFSM